MKKINNIINDRLTKAFHAVINQQIDEKNPPEVLETFERLQEEGFSKEEAYALISQLISLEVAEELTGKGQINVNRYVDALGILPKPFTQPKKNDID